MLQLKSKPALLIVDMQNGFCHRNGTFGKLEMPVERMFSIIPAINTLRKLCHERHIPVYFTRMSWRADYSDSGILLEGPHSAVKTLEGFVRDTWDSAIVNELQPRENEVVIEKTRNTAFWGTDFLRRLEGQDINQLIVTGVGTNICVESTVRDAFTNGIYAVTVTDATATLSDEAQQATMNTLQWFGGTASVSDVSNALEAYNGPELATTAL